MRVLSIIHHGVWGGPHNRNSRMIPLLEARGIRTVVLLPNEGDGAQRMRWAGVETVQIRLGRLRGTFLPTTHLRYLAGFFSEVPAIRRVIRQHKIDLVQINGLGNPQGAIAARLERIPMVWELLDDTYPKMFRVLMMSLVVRLADVLMVTGMGVARVHPGALSFDDRLFSFFPPVDVNLFKPDAELRRVARLELGLAPEDLVIGTVGNINPQKDHANLIRAAACLRRTFPRVRFVILGATLENRSRLTDGLWRLAERLGLRLGEDLIVRNPGSHVARLAQAFDIFWLTSRREGIPTALEEAMALNLPVVATDVGAVAEAVEDGVTGFVVPARDPEAIARATIPLIGDPQLRARVGEKARRIAVERFDLAICADIHARAFEKAVANGLAHGKAA